MSDFVPNQLGFDAGACLTAIKHAANAYMSDLADKLILIMKEQIDSNGNGTDFMKSDAKKVVREILHEMTDEYIKIDAGFDEEMASGMAKDFFVRVMVVMHGNQGGGPITTKPGSSTYKKNVLGYGPSTAKTVYDIPQFNQNDVSAGILKNTMKEVQMHFKTMLAQLSEMFTANFFGQFITGG